MGSINTQGNAQAYPSTHDPLQSHAPGLSKLEVFTCAALAGLCVGAENLNVFDHKILNISTDAVKIAKATIDQLNRMGK